METQRHIYALGNGTTLALEVDPSSADEIHFATGCRQVADTYPDTIHDFFNRLADIQRRQHVEMNDSKPNPGSRC